jgi:RNA polymerase sigma-70 factor (ECF subfamily)
MPPNGWRREIRGIELKLDYERLVSRHRDSVYRQMIRACGNPDDAEDALVEALLAAYRSLDDIRDEQAFRSWLAVVGRRVCSRIKRREDLAPVLSLSGFDVEDLEVADPNDGPDRLLELDDVAKTVESVVVTLPQSLREAYELCDLNHVSIEKASQQLQISPAAVKSRLHRARVAVRSALDKCLAESTTP